MASRPSLFTVGSGFSFTRMKERHGSRSTFTLRRMEPKRNSGCNQRSKSPTMMVTTPVPYATCWESWRPTGIGLRVTGMNSSAQAKSVRFDQDSMWVDLSDGRVIGVPLAWIPRLLRASEEQRRQVRITGRGLHWESLDEDISIAGLLAGLGDKSTDQRTFAA
jgi:hypothetical protein